MTVDVTEIEKRINDSYELPNAVVDVVPHPLVTVRTYTYQHGDFVRQCLEGVLMQKTTFPFEFIIGEDFSTDGTREIVFEYAQRYPEVIRVITADYNVGGEANVIRCRRRTRGKYIALCDGDDYWTDPLKLQKQVDFLEAHPEYGLVHTDCDALFVAENKIVPGFLKNFWHSHQILSGLSNNLAQVNTMLFRKVAYRLGIERPIHVFSEMNPSLQGPINSPGDWGWAIAQAVGANEFINRPGGATFIDESGYRERGIKLTFQSFTNMTYSCGKYHQFEPDMSIIDVMMWNSPEQIKRYLDTFRSTPPHNEDP